MNDKNRFDVTVLITNYNKILYIQDAVDSALSQGVKVVVVDDCSTDGSFELLRNNDNITLLQTPSNSGPSVATQIGAENIDTEYTILLDGDDVLSSNSAEYFMKLASMHDADAIYTKQVRDEDEDFRALCVPTDVTASYKVIDDPIGYFLKHKQFASTSLCVRTVILKMSIDTSFFIQDLIIAANIARYSHKSIFTDAHTHYYSPVTENNLLSNISLNTKNKIWVYLFCLDLPEFRNHKHFIVYTKRIYGSLPAFDFQYPWLSRRWKRRVLRWYRRYFIIWPDYDCIKKELNYFIENVDGNEYCL